MPYSIKFDRKICYKASQCTDIDDCIIALNILDEYMLALNKIGYSAPRAYYQRKFSLEKKAKKLAALL
jgi:hypothetical protein